MKDVTRASLRATGQLGLLTMAVNVTVGTVEVFISHAMYTGRVPGEYFQPRFYGQMALMVAAAVVAFWASTRTGSYRRHCGIALAAGALAVGLALLEIVFELDGFGSVNHGWWLVRLVVGTLWPFGVWVCLIVSYLGPPVRLDEPGALRPRSPWIWMIAAPLAGLDVLIGWLERYHYLPESSVVGLLAVGLLYGLMRRHQPVPGAAGWVLTTWPLIALTLPAYTLGLVTAARSDVESLTRQSIATTVAVVILTVVIGPHLVTRCRARPTQHDTRDRESVPEDVADTRSHPGVRR